MRCSGFRFSRHAFERMFQRSIPPSAVTAMLEEGEVIDSYPDDIPFPSSLILESYQGLPLHIVVGRDPDTGLCHVVTTYRPDPEMWDTDFKTRRNA